MLTHAARAAAFVAVIPDPRRARLEGYALARRFAWRATRRAAASRQQGLTTIRNFSQRGEKLERLTDIIHSSFKAASATLWPCARRAKGFGQSKPRAKRAKVELWPEKNSGRSIML